METRKAVQQLSSGKAPGADAIPAEVYKAGGLPMAEKLTELFHCMWRKEAIPQEFKDASIIHLYKRKGNPQVCDNHRGISLLSIAGKILAKILLNRLNVHLDQKGLIPESQCGFRKDRGTIDMIFTARQLQEKCQEQNVDLYMTFVDLTKAFDTVSRDGLWKIMAKFGCPPRFNASSEAKMQRAMDQVSQSCDNYDLTISTKKTEVVHQPAPGKPYNEPTITVNGEKLKVVDKFTYLGSTLSRAVHIDDEVTARIAKASVAFGRLRANVWERNGIKLDTKLKVYKAVVLPTLLYACETWTVYQRHAKRLNHFHFKSCLRKLLKIKWQDKIPDTEVLKKAGMQSMHTVLKLAQLRWTGHVIRMPDERLPKKVFYGELQEGKRSQGGQKKRYKDTLKASLKDFDIPIGSWEQTAQERSKWRGLINKGAALHEKKRICEAERKRRERKANTNGPPADSMTLTCSTCNRQFRARIGLVSHQRTHQHTRTYSRNNDGLSH